MLPQAGAGGVRCSGGATYLNMWRDDAPLEMIDKRIEMLFVTASEGAMRKHFALMCARNATMAMLSATGSSTCFAVVSRASNAVCCSRNRGVYQELE